jgi:metallo-beta-lactamase class B
LKKIIKKDKFAELLKIDCLSGDYLTILLRELNSMLPKPSNLANQMKKEILTITSLAVTLLFLYCSVYASDYRTIKISDDIELIQLSEKAYVHVSVSEIEGFGKVSSNGLLFVNGDEAFLFDTPATNSQTETLVKWITDSLSTKVSTFVPTHWHDDCLGGLEFLHRKGIKSYANQMTIDLAKANEKAVPQYAFVDSLRLVLYNETVDCHYFEHTGKLLKE